MSRRPSEVITSLRERAEKAKENHISILKKGGVIKGGRHARYCPAGHCFQRALLTHRQLHIQEQQNLPVSILPPITCDGCATEIRDEYVAGSCKACDMDFCRVCYGSGRPIEELLEDGLELQLDSTASLSYGEMDMSLTDEYCSMGHQLSRVYTVQRKRYLQERDCLESSPSIECNCCSKTITTEKIAGCCFECDIDFCEDCFKSGQSFEDFLQEPVDNDDEPQVGFGERYNGLRPSYKGTGRMSYDDYPDPTAFQWSFTGSCEDAGVEFFEKDFGRGGIVKMDFHYAKGKIRTVLDHPKKGIKLLFARRQKVSSRFFRKVLLDPRTHKDKKSRRKRTQVL